MKGAQHAGYVKQWATLDLPFPQEAGPPLPPLPGTRREVTASSRRLPGGDNVVLTGAEATEANVRRLARRQTSILKYIDFRFRPQVRVDEAEVRAAWDQERAARPGAEAFEDAAAGVRARLEGAELDRRIEQWIKELRAGAEIRYNSLAPS